MAKDKPSKVEQAKLKSNYLRGTIAEVLADTSIEAFEHDDIQAMKFHGIYQQDDRDKREGKHKEYSFMIRTKLPGGRMTSEQYLAMDDIAQRFTHPVSLRITTRQAFQFHGVIKGELKTTMQQMNKALVSSIAACGDIECNVMCTPAPIHDSLHDSLRSMTDEIATKLAPATGAYYEIWLDGEKVVREENASGGEEPFYGEAYLPRKFKTGVALPEDNSVDVYTQDCGLVGVHDGEKITAVNVLVGGGLGMTHRKEDTFARMGSQLGSVAPEHAADAVKTVVSIHRDFGNRSDRRHARLKYVIDDNGMDWFRNEFRKRADFPLNDWIDVGQMKLNDYLGKHDQGDGKFFYGVFVENGRIKDEGDAKALTAFRTIAQQLNPTVILTPNQSIIFADLSDDDVTKLEAILAEHGVAVNQVKGVRRFSMACPALPTCGLALAESERYLPSLIDAIEPVLAEHGLEDEPITIRMTGCPNGCARPYTADLAFVGRKPGEYDIFVGGRLAGDRMAELYAESVDESEILDKLKPLFTAWATKRQGDESLGDFYNRAFADDEPRTKVTGSKEVESYEKVAAGA